MKLLQVLMALVASVTLAISATTYAAGKVRLQLGNFKNLTGRDLQLRLGTNKVIATLPAHTSWGNNLHKLNVLIPLLHTPDLTLQVYKLGKENQLNDIIVTNKDSEINSDNINVEIRKYKTGTLDDAKLGVQIITLVNGDLGTQDFDISWNSDVLVTINGSIIDGKYGARFDDLELFVDVR